MLTHLLGLGVNHWEFALTRTRRKNNARSSEQFFLWSKRFVRNTHGISKKRRVRNWFHVVLLTYICLSIAIKYSFAAQTVLCLCYSSFPFDVILLEFSLEGAHEF